MESKSYLLFLFMLFSCSSAFAIFHPVITLSSGMARANVYSSQVISFSPFQNSYVGNSHFDTEADTGLFIGGETVLPHDLAWQIGVSYFENSSFIETGNVYQFSDPAFNNLTYQYQIQSRRFSLDTQLAHVVQEIWHPYISASIGHALNKAYQYTEYPVTSADAPMTQPFANHTTSSFTYSLGFGVTINITEHWRAGAGYRFVELGNASLGVSPLQSGTETINNAHLSANELLAQLSYVG